jgi:4-alpha-glucanotransferase
VAINEQAEAALRAKVQAWIGAADDLEPAEVVRRVYRLLGRAPCALLTATLDDALMVEERPNMPGTQDEWPNWRIALPQPLDDLENVPLAHAIASAMRRVR